jgi:hypothetical protein
MVFDTQRGVRLMAGVVGLCFGALTLTQSLKSGTGSNSAAGDGGLPALIRINLDGSYARYVGKSANGGQFLISNARIDDRDPMGGPRRRYFVTFYQFDADGNFQRAQIDEVPEGLDKATALAALEKVKVLRDHHLKAIGPVTFSSIAVSPFQVVHADTPFGLIAESVPGQQLSQQLGQPLQAQPLQVVLQPGRIMTFRTPWNGDYRN